MYGCFTPVIVYGVLEPQEDLILSNEILERYNVQWYATSVIRNQPVNIIYGVGTCEFGEPTEEEIETVNQFSTFFRAQQPPKQYLCIFGDIEIERERYVFDDSTLTQ